MYKSEVSDEHSRIAQAGHVVPGDRSAARHGQAHGGEALPERLDRRSRRTAIAARSSTPFKPVIDAWLFQIQRLPRLFLTGSSTTATWSRSGADHEPPLDTFLRDHNWHISKWPLTHPSCLTLNIEPLPIVKGQCVAPFSSLGSRPRVITRSVPPVAKRKDRS